MLVVAGIVIGIAVGVAAAVIAIMFLERSRLGSLRKRRAQLVGDAEREAEAMRREAQIESRERELALRAALDDEVRERRLEVARTEERIATLEQELDRKLTE